MTDTPKMDSRSLRIVPSLFLAGAFVLGAAGVAGYLKDDAAMAGFWTGRGATGGLTGLFLMALAVSVALRRRARPSGRTAAFVLALSVALGALLEVAASFFARGVSSSGVIVARPLHPSPVTSEMILTLALMALTAGRTRTRILSHVLGSVIFASCLVVLFGMVYSVPWFDANTRVFPVLSTTVALLLLSGASLLIEPAGWMRVLLSPTGAGKLSRLLLPAAIAIPMLTALAVHGGHEVGALSRGDLTVVVAVNMLVATALIVGAGALIERREAESRRVASLADQELHRREQEFKALVENTPDIISRFDRNLIRRYTNPAVERLLGVPPSELIGKRYGGFGPFHGGENALREVFATGQEVMFEQQIHSPDGTRFLQSRIAPELDRNHEVEFALSITRDVTEIRRNEERLRESEAQFANAQRIAKVGSFELVLETGQMRWSEELFRVVGLSYGDPPSTRFLMSGVAAREDSNALLRAFQTAENGGALQHLEYRFTRPDGVERILAISMEPARDPVGAVTKVTGTVQDLTELREAEQSVRYSEQRLRDLIDSAKDAILTLDLTGRVLEVNPAVVQMFGEPAEALAGRHITHSIHPGHVESIGRALQEVVVTGSVARIAAPVRTAQGDYIEIEASASRQTRKGADAIFIIGRDVTAQRRAESERLALTQSIELLLASTYEGICVTDLGGICTMVNSSAAQQLGYTQAEILGRNIHELIHHSRADGSPYPQADCPNFAAAREKRRLHSVDEVYWRRDGTFFPVELFVSPIMDGSGTVQGIVMSFIDVTERRFLQTELELANRLAGLGRVAATMSHEFNNVLMGIQPFADALLRSSDPKVLEVAARITQSVKRGRRVTDELRGFTRPVPPDRTTFDVEAWLEDCSKEISRLLPANIELTCAVTESLAIEADREQVTQVITNLVLNARDAIGSASGMVRISARPARPGEKFSRGEMPSGRPFVCISVADDGPGILPEHLPRLFEPFFSTRPAGTGLGLPIAQQIVTLHGGFLFVESEGGRGATVHFLLPEARKVPAAIEHEPVPIMARAEMPMNILLVEDDEAVAAGLSALLEHEGFDLRHAADGAIALRLLEDRLPHVLIIDVGLPDCNGFDLYDDIAARHGAIPVVFSSGHADAGRLSTLQPGTSARLLTKPYGVDTLLRTLQQVCEPRPERSG